MTKKERLMHLTNLLEKGLKFAEIKQDEIVKKWNLKDGTLSKYIAECKPQIPDVDNEDTPVITQVKTSKQTAAKNKLASIEHCKITAELLEKQLNDVIIQFHAGGVGITALKSAKSQVKQVNKILVRYA